MKNKFDRMMLALVCLIILGLMTSCQSQDTNSTGAVVIPTVPLNTPEPTDSPLPSATPTLAPTPGVDEIHMRIVNALLALYTQPNRMDVTTILGDSQTRTNVIEFVPPDRKRLIDLDEGVEYIVVGEKVYSKTKTSGEWKETQIPASTFMGDQEVTAQMISETISDEQWLRKDTLNGKAVIVYDYKSTTMSNDIELHSRTELWVGENDGLPYKMVIDGEILAASTDPNTGESKLQAVKALTTTLVDFNLTINIEQPVQ